MKATISTLLLLLPFTFLAACASPDEPPPPRVAEAVAEAVTEAEAVPEPPAGGTVRETMDSLGYTYVRVGTDGRSAWAAGPKTAVKVGDRVKLPAGILMKDFHSKRLGRTFDWLWLIGSIEVEGAAPAQPDVAAMHGKPATDPAAAAAFDFTRIKKPAGGLTVAEIHVRRAELAGKTVTVCAIAVKATPEVMGRNWLHLRDGTGAPGTDDLTVTSAELAQVGKVVLVTGTVVVNRDFGFGYEYEVMLEDAKLTAQ